MLLSSLRIDCLSCRHDYLQQVSLLFSWEGEARACQQIFHSLVVQVIFLQPPLPILYVPAQASHRIIAWQNSAN